MQLEFHPVANIFPLMAGAEYDALVSDIAQHGQAEPIWLHDGMILDGRNRYRACLELGLVPDMREYTGDDPQAFVVSLNLHRRHLTREQRDEVIRQLRTNGMTLQKIADAVGVGVGTVHRAIDDAELFQMEKLPGDDGKYRPMHYAARTVELEPEDDEPDAWQYEPEPEPVRMAHVGQNSGENEWYTPAPYIEAALAVMGSIDLDPASSDVANTVVGASAYFTAQDDGLSQDWHGRIWMNPPYAQPLVSQFCAKLRDEYDAGNVTGAIVLVNNATETAWFQRIIGAASAVCFPLARVKFWAPDRMAAPLQGQAVVYLGNDPAAFIREFAAFGWCARVV